MNIFVLFITFIMGAQAIPAERVMGPRYNPMVFEQSVDCDEMVEAFIKTKPPGLPPTKIECREMALDEIPNNSIFYGEDND